MGASEREEKRQGGCMMKSIIIKAVSSPHLEQSGEFVLACLLDLLFTPLSQMCHARGGTWLKSLLDSLEPLQCRLWVKWPESYFERRPPGSRLQHPPQQWNNNGEWSWWEEKHILCDSNIMEKSQQLWSQTRQGLVCVRSFEHNTSFLKNKKSVTTFLTYLNFWESFIIH